MKKINFKKINWKMIGNVLYWVFIVFVLFAVVLLVFSSFNIPGSLKLYVVKSGSMEPAIKMGSLVIVGEADEYKVDDIVTFSSITDARETTTHRIIEVIESEPVTTYRTKGDANDVADSFMINKGRIIGKAKLAIPFLGYLTAFVKTWPGLIILIIIPATIIIYEEVQKIIKEVKKRGQKNASVKGK